jgi:hypothetical protein
MIRDYPTKILNYLLHTHYVPHHHYINKRSMNEQQKDMMMTGPVLRIVRRHFPSRVLAVRVSLNQSVFATHPARSNGCLLFVKGVKRHKQGHCL